MGLSFAQAGIQVNQLFLGFFEGFLDAADVFCSIAGITFDDVKNLLKLSGSSLGKEETSMLAAFEEGCGQLYCRHACGECESSCPHQVPVNTIMRYNHYFDAHGSEKYALEKYALLAASKADNCRDCTGWCEKSCPYGVPIQGLLNIAHTRLTLT